MILSVAKLCQVLKKADDCQTGKAIGVLGVPYIIVIFINNNNIKNVINIVITRQSGYGKEIILPEPPPPASDRKMKFLRVLSPRWRQETRHRKGVPDGTHTRRIGAKGASCLTTQGSISPGFEPECRQGWRVYMSSADVPLAGEHR